MAAARTRQQGDRAQKRAGTRALPGAVPIPALAPALALTLAATISGCATVPQPTPGDPLEGYNRSMFSVNEAVDRAVFKPLARGYEAVTPGPVRTCIGNIFSNVGDLFSSLHSFLQGRAHDGVNSFGRVLLNSTLGLGGCLDLASKKGVPRIPNDLGTTLGVWGVGNGPYVVLPLLGASTLRDSTGMGLAAWSSTTVNGAIFQIDNVPLRNGVFALNTVDLRAGLMDVDDMVNRIALDRYSFIRDGYLQRRAAMVQGQIGRMEATDDDDVLPDYEYFDDGERENGSSNGDGQ